MLYVSRTPWVHMGDWFEFPESPQFDLKDSDKLETRLVESPAINPTTGTEKSIKYRSRNLNNVDIIGTTDKHIVVSANVPEYGRFLTDFDVRNKRYVCVIGASAECSFEGVNPLNRRIKNRART
ncbi:MAG: ABC transporter permease [Calditrichia bacterium]